MTPRIRKLALTAHVTCSVGWLGAVVAFLPLAVAGLVSADAATVRGSYLAMELLAWYALVPLSLASLLTGVVQALGTPWGLFRHYWVVAKLLIAVLATAILLVYMRTITMLADLAAAGGDLAALRNPSPVLHAVLALLALIAATALSVYKPRGTTRYGRRKQQARNR